MAEAVSLVTLNRTAGLGKISATKGKGHQHESLGEEPLDVSTTVSLLLSNGWNVSTA